MNIILFGYNGLIGSYILKELAQQLKKFSYIKIICVGRNIENKPFKSKKIIYIKWDFLNFVNPKLSFFIKKNIIINCIGKNNGNSKNLSKINFKFIQKLINYIQENKIEARLIHLGSVSVYSTENKDLGKNKNIKENSITKPIDLYSKSKLEADNFIQKSLKNKNNKLSYTILRITNVFSCSKNSNAFNLIRFLLNKGIWFKCSNNTIYHFIHVKDVVQAVLLCVLKPKNSKNKIYIVSDDENQFELHKIYAKIKNINLLKLPISSKLLKFFFKYFFLPKKLINFFFTISSEINYDNSKLKKELNFKTKYSLRDQIF
jgi:nucleoside-diphosphate-sugar epimerase